MTESTTVEQRLEFLAQLNEAGELSKGDSAAAKRFAAAGITEADRKVARMTLGEPIFQGALFKEHTGWSRCFRPRWKQRFFRLYFDRLEYGTWTKKGRLRLRPGSPVLLNHTMQVEESAGSQRLVRISVRQHEEAPEMVVSILDDPKDTRNKLLRLLRELHAVERAHKVIHRHRERFLDRLADNPANPGSGHPMGASPANTALRPSDGGESRQHGASASGSVSGGSVGRRGELGSSMVQLAPSQAKLRGVADPP